MTFINLWLLAREVGRECESGMIDSFASPYGAITVPSEFHYWLT